jgi:hypothetical protein
VFQKGLLDARFGSALLSCPDSPSNRKLLDGPFQEPTSPRDSIQRNDLTMTTGLECPVCGRPFRSDWALASHIAGTIKHSWGDKEHKAWARMKIPDLELSYTMPELAGFLLQALRPVASASEARPVANPLELIHATEIALHRHIKRRLEGSFGLDGDEWWARGVPLEIRKGCAQRREEDPGRNELFSYTYLIDLQTIIDKNWSLFEADFLRVRKEVQSKKEFLDSIRRINNIRNRHSHPIRAPERGTEAFEDDLRTVVHDSKYIEDFCNQ